MFFFRRRTQTRKSRPAIKARQLIRRLPLSLEVLESRVLLSADSWIGGSGNWDVASHWGLGHAPGTGDTAIIKTSSAATITIQSGDNIQIQNLTLGSNDTLSFTGGALTVTSGASTLSGALSMSGGNVTASGSGVSLTANGSTSVSGASLYAEGGANLSLPKLTSFTMSSGISTLEATGSGSVLSLAKLSSVSVVDTGETEDHLDIKALAGGSINLPTLTQINTAVVNLGSDGSGSVLNVSNLASFITQANFTGNSSLSQTNGGTIDDGKLANLSAISATLDGSAPNVANSWTTFTNGTLIVTGGSLSLSNLTDFSNSTTQLSGGAAVSFPVLTSGTITISNNSSVSIQGATISMPADGTSGATINVPSSSGLTIILEDSGLKGLTGTTINVGVGSNVVVAGGTYLGTTTFNVAQGATVNLTGAGTTTYGGTLTGSGEGTVQLSGTFAAAAGGATLNFPGSMFQWTGGSMDLSVGDVKNEGTINLSGANQTQIYADGTLDNFGTIIQTGTGNFGLRSNNVTPTTLKIEPGGQYLLESDAGINNLANTNLIDNEGTVRKTAGIGTSTIAVTGSLINTGAIEADSGTLDLAPSSFAQISNSTLTGGTWNALKGAKLQFPDGTSIATNQANVSLAGSGASITALAGLDSNSGILSLTNGATLATSGDFSNSGSLTVGSGSTLTVMGNFTQTSTGTLRVQLSGSPGSGQFGQLTVQNAASLAGDFNVNQTNSGNPSKNAVYPVMTFASAAGTFTKVTGLSSPLAEQLTATGLDLVTGAGAPVNLQLSQVTAPTNAITGQQITVNWQVQNAGNTAASGNWLDSVYLSTTASITDSSVLLGSVIHSGGLAADGSYSASLTAAVPALPPGDYYVLVQTDSLDQVLVVNRANAILTASTGQLAVSVPVLTLGTPTKGTFTTPDPDQYYQVTVPAGGSLQMTLTSSASSGAVALYVSASTEPTPYSYQYAANVANQTSQTLLVPSAAAPTTYYILAQGVSGAAATAGFTVTAKQTNALTVLPATTPYSAGNGGIITLPIAGTNFSTTTTASLTLGSKTINASSIYYQSGSEIYATFNLQGAATGSYTLNVTSGGQTVTSPTPVQVVSAINTTNQFQLVLTPPSQVPAGRDSDVYVTVTNTSNNDILAPLLELTAQGATLKLPTQSAFQGSTLYFLATSPTGPAGILTPGESVRVDIQFQSLATLPTIQFQLNYADDSKPMDWASQEQALQIPTIPNAAWPIVFSNFTAAMGSTVASYHDVLSADATYLANLGEPTNDVLQLVEFEIEKANAAYTAQTLATVTADTLPAPGMDLSFSQSYLASISGRYYQGILGAQGWTTNWDITAKTTSTGDASIQMSGSYFFFFLQPDGSYLPSPGEEGATLTLTNGAYRLVEPNGTIYQFNTNGTLDYVQDSNGNKITATYNNAGQLTQLTDSNGEYLKLGYNTQGQMATLTDSNGQTENYGYTGQFLTSYSGAYGTTNYSYATGGTTAQNGSLAQIAYADNTHVYFRYDGHGRLIEQHPDNGGEDKQFSYPTTGGITTTDGDGNQTTVLFNLFGVTAETIDGLGHVTQYRYDANLNLVQLVAPGGLTYSYSYDANGNLASEIDPLGHTSTFTYNGNNDLTSSTDARGYTTNYAYDGNNNLLSITYANGTSQQYTYNPLGEATYFVDANGNAISATYNVDGQLATESFADGTSYAYKYNAQGNLISATDAQGRITIFVYGDPNNPDLLTKVEYPDGTWLQFTYNTAGQRTQSVDQTGFTVNYKHDSLGRLSKLTDAKNELIVQYVYDNAGNLIQKDNGNGTFTVYTYDAENRMASITNYAPSTGGTPYVPANSTVNSFDNYTYDSLGNVLTDTNQDGEWTYTYDGDNQLTGAVFTLNAKNPDKLSAQNLQYVYDLAGNRISETVNGVVTTYVTNYVNEYTSSTTAGVGTTNYKYDNNGNLISTTDPSNNTTSYTYNQLNELLGVSGLALTASYAYNPLGQMVSQTMNGVTTNSQIDPTGLGNVVATFNGSGVYNNNGGLTAHYTYGFGLVSQVSADGSAGYYDFDLTGNTVGITGPTGAYSNQYVYLPFGQTTVLKGTLANPFTYLGQRGVTSSGDELFNVGGREYDSLTGRFVSNDGPGNFLRTVPLPIDHPPGSELLSLRDQPPEIAPPSGVIRLLPIVTPPTTPLKPGPTGNTSNPDTHDSNALVGPAGYGTQGFIQATGDFTYTIDFANDGAAAAQTVTATEQLDPNLDWSTFQLGSFGFGTVQVAIPAGLTQYQTTVPYHNIDGSTLDVKISLNFNVRTGLLTVAFTSIDPATGQFPSAVLDGFLPPDNGSGIGEGFVQYTVQPKAGLAGGTISAQAAVVFDTNAPISTKTVTNTIDATPPSSSVNPLPTVSPPSFTVSWSGSDPNGPGIASYDVFVADNRGAFTPWLINTTQTSATFTGQVGHLYRFFSVAVDQLGLTQQPPPVAQATTYVWVSGPHSSGGSPSTRPVPQLQKPPLLAFIDSILGGIETINSNGTETVVDSLFGFVLFVSTYNGAGVLESVTLFGIDITFLFKKA